MNARIARRSAPVPVAFVGLVAGIAIAGPSCGGDDEADQGATSTTTAATTTAASTTGAGGAGGVGGAGGAGAGGANTGATGPGGSGGGGGGGGTGGGEPNNGTIEKATPAISGDPGYPVPFDVAPSADGTVLYFTAIATEGPGVFAMPASGGSIVQLAGGDPLVAPMGIALGLDGKKLYVTDVATEGKDTDGGRIFVVDAEGGAPAELTVTDATKPRGIDVGTFDGKETVFFTGIDGTGAPGLFRIPAVGGEPTALAKGPPFVDPSGVAVTAAGDKAYVLDTIASSRSLASIIEIAGGTATEFVAHLPVGYPAGIALSLDESALLVSGFSPDGQGAVLRVDLLSKEITHFSPDGNGFEPGGLHRARNADVYAWTDRAATGGTILVLE